MSAVEVHADEVIAPAYIDDGDKNAVLVEHGDLRLRSRESRSHEQQSGQRLVRRLGATVDHIKRPTKLCQTTGARMQRRNRFDIADLHVGRIHERIDTVDARDEIQAPADIESCAGGGGHAHAVDASSLAGLDTSGSVLNTTDIHGSAVPICTQKRRFAYHAAHSTA